MAEIACGQDTTFTITSVPQRPADRKTLTRLMQMEPSVKKGLRALAKKRRQHDNRTYIRAGVEWTDRKKATKIVRVAQGESFTVHVTPQIVNDLKSVERFISAK